MTGTDAMILIEDSREQVGFGTEGLFSLPYVVSGLAVGDYSVVGLESLIAVERKSLQDLLGSVTNGRDRFESELKRSRHLHKFYVVVECSARDLLVDSFGRLSKANPKSVWATVTIWSSRYAPFLFAGDRITAARWTEALLGGYAREFMKNSAALERASRKAASDAA